MRNSLLFTSICLPVLLVAGFWNPPADFTHYDSAHWIDSGLAHERDADFPAAEHELLVAAQVDHLFNPRWTLAGFYFRRGERGKFLHWTGEALTVGQRDLGALFDLCWKLPDGCSSIWNTAMPDSKPAWHEYLYFLMTTGKWPAAAYTARMIARKADTIDKGLLLNYCDLAIERGDKSGARVVWDQLCRRKLLPFAAGQVVVNGEFQFSPSAHGFDWRIVAPGVSNSIQSGEASFTLNGFQQEREVLLEQPLAIDATVEHRLNFEYKTTGLQADSGVHWAAGKFESASLSSAAWSQGHLDFSGPAEALELTYHRSAGSTLAQGSISVRNISIVVR